MFNYTACLNYDFLFFFVLLVRTLLIFELFVQHVCLIINKNLICVFFSFIRLYEKKYMSCRSLYQNKLPLFLKYTNQ